MAFLAPRIAPGIGIAMARVASRFYFFSILLVASTVFLPHQGLFKPVSLIFLAVLTVSAAVAIRLVPWDDYPPRVFTLAHLFTSCTLLALLVLFTGGSQSNYDLLFFLVILFSYFYNLREMLFIATVVVFFSLFPFLYDNPDAHYAAASVVKILFYYLGTYILYGVTRFVLKKNRVLEDLNRELTELYSITSDMLKDMERESLLESLSERLKDHLPSTYCLVMLFDEKLNLVVKIACPIRTLTWEPNIGAVHPSSRLPIIMKAIESRQPHVFRLDEGEEIDRDIAGLLTRTTKSVMVVPIRIAAENVGVLVFGEERGWQRAPFDNERIQLAVAISKQVGIAVNMWWAFERMKEAKKEIEIAHDKVIKAERLATLGEVTRAVEHEINNPLNVILNWSEIYREDENIDPELRKKFQIIYDMSMRIRDVIKKLSAIKDAKSIEFIDGQKMTNLE